MDSPVKYFNDDDINCIKEKFNVSGMKDLLVPHYYRGLKTLMKIAYLKPPWIPTFIMKDMYKNLYSRQAEDKKGLIRMLEVEKTFYARQEYNFDFPVLLIWGEGDNLIPLRIGKQLKEHIGKNAEMVIIPNAAHMPALEQAKAFNKTVLNFLKK